MDTEEKLWDILTTNGIGGTLRTRIMDIRNLAQKEQSKKVLKDVHRTMRKRDKYGYPTIRFTLKDFRRLEKKYVLKNG